jgi:hypothetical protein
LKVGFVRQAVGETHHYRACLPRKGMKTHFLTSGGLATEHRSAAPGLDRLIVRVLYSAAIASSIGGPSGHR